MITLYELRKKNNLTQKELGELLNISEGAVGMYETGKRTPPLHRAIEISKFFGVPVENILFEKKCKFY